MSVLLFPIHVKCLLKADVFTSRLGRQKSLLVSLMFTVVFGVLVCVSPSPPVFITMRFCLAAASAGVYITLYVTRKSDTGGTRTMDTLFCAVVMTGCVRVRQENHSA